MPAPFTSTMDPSVGQYYTPNAGTYGGQNPNPNPAQTSQSNPLGWGNVNTYAPWTTPNGMTGQNPSFGQYGANTTAQTNPQAWDSPLMGAAPWALGQLLQSKKRASPNFYAPSYQGTLFQPSYGYGATYGMSQEGQNASMQQSMQQPAGSPPPSGQGQPSAYGSGAMSGSFGSGPSYAGVSGLGSNQSYVGQSPYSVPGGTYVPGQGGQSYGGYSSYGGYGASNAGTQPYFPGQ